MAIPIIVKSNTLDRDVNKFIGIKLPLELAEGREGYFESTIITIDAAKENIRNLVKTRKGERMFQPNFGLGLDSLLFENVTEELKMMIQDDIINTFKFWLPYITVRNVNIIVNSDQYNQNTIKIDVEFFMNYSPGMLESVQVEVT